MKILINSILSEVKLYLSFGSFVPIKILGLYIIPALIVSNHIVFSLNGIITAIALSFLNFLLVMINSYRDFDIDKIAHPSRPLPSGQITFIKARIYIILTTIIFIFLLVLTKSYVIITTSIVMLIYYNSLNYLKHSKVNKPIYSVLYGLAAPLFTGTFLYLVGYAIFMKHNIQLFLFSVAMILLDIGHDSFQYILDREGDEKEEIITILKVFGEKKLIYLLLLCDILVLIFMLLFCYCFEIVLIVRFIFIGIITWLGLMLLICDIKYLQNTKRENAIIGKLWHNWPLFALGICLIGIKLKPDYFFIPFSIALLIISYYDARRRAYKDVYFFR